MEKLDTPLLKKYSKLYKKYQETNDSNTQEQIQGQIEEMWYDLDEDEIAYIEINNMSI